MRAYILRRLLFGVLIIWGVYTLTFFAVNLAPGDPFANLENPRMQKEGIERLRKKWGYDKPVLERYVLQLRKTLWADVDILTSEANGLTFETLQVDGANALRASVQVPVDTVEVKPTERSEIEGSRAVTLTREDDLWGPTPILPGIYIIGDVPFGVREDGTADPLATQGLTFVVRDGEISAQPTLDQAPEQVVLEHEEGPVTLEKNADGTYGPTTLAPGPYVYAGVNILIPEDLLSDGGPTFDLGYSVMHKKSVTAYLWRPLLNTLLLASAALFLDFLIGILIGVISAIRPNSKTDHALTLGSLFVYSMPGFWLALMLVLLFAVKLDWLPAEGMNSPGESGFLDTLEHMILPTFVLGIAAAASTARYQRSALLEVMSQDYIRTARAKGLSESAVIWKHAMRNSLLPVITLIGLSLPFLVSGAVITEKIFSWPGMGSAVIEAITSRDVFVLTGITLISTSMVVVGNLMADILYAFADPRVRLQ